MDNSKPTDGIEDYDKEVPLAEARITGNPHIATRFRWRSRGVKRNGRVVKLRTVSAGSRVFTTQRWVDEFKAACSGDFPADSNSAPNETRRRKETRDAVLAMV